MTNDLDKDTNNFFPSIIHDDDNLYHLLNEVSRVICDWFKDTNNLSPLPQKLDFINVDPSEYGLHEGELINEIKKLIYSSYVPSHPGSLAHLDPPPLTASIIGDLIAGALNNNLLAEDLSPSISLLENDICRWIASKLNLGINSGGIAASGGTLNNLNALVTARHISGLDHDPNAAFILSEDAHVSFKKCARIIGLKEENMILVSTNSDGKMSISSLLETIQRAKAMEKKIFAIIATLGTTIRGAIDPIVEIDEICRKEEIWLHIDGSIGGIFSLASNNLDGFPKVIYANSITINPQKVLGITKTSSILLVSNMKTLKDTFYTGLPYIDSSDDVVNRGELGVQGSRPAEIIKLWISIQLLGLNGINKVVSESITKRLNFEKLLDSSKFEIFSGPLHIISFIPKGMNIDQSNIWTLNKKKILMDNKFMISRPFYKDRFCLRIVFGNFNTKESHLIKLSQLINE